MTVADSQTARLLGQGRRLEHFTIGWNVLEAGVSVWAGIVAGSTALIGFGLDSAHIAATETPFPEKIGAAAPSPHASVSGYPPLFTGLSVSAHIAGSVHQRAPYGLASGHTSSRVMPSRTMPPWIT